MVERPTEQNKRRRTWLILFAVVVLLAAVVSLPPVWSRVDYRAREVYRTVKYWLQPPSEAVFVPSTKGNAPEVTPVSAAVIASSPTVTPTTQPTTESTALPTDLTPEPTITPTSLPTLTLTPTSLPSSVLLKGFMCERQLMNNCGPATLSVNLSYYDWGKTQDAVDIVVKPNSKDVNVMPYELVDFVNTHTEMRALWRYGGDLQTLRSLLNAGFPVMIEKSFEPFDLRYEGWMGHYNLVAGYDDGKETLTVHDTYLMIKTPWGLEIPFDQFDTFIGFDFSYSELEQAWRSFNFTFLVVYPPEKEDEVLKALGPLATEEEAIQVAYDRAKKETTSLTDTRDQYFAWFNVGTNLVKQKNFPEAAAAFDTAFAIYPQIDQKSRPYRILWYETGPYEAYYNTERYQDVINLATQTLAYMADPVLEESYYWRALSYNALGDTARAEADLRSSLIYHPGYAPSIKMLEQLGKKP